MRLRRTALRMTGKVVSLLFSESSCKGQSPSPSPSLSTPLPSLPLIPSFCPHEDEKTQSPRGTDSHLTTTRCEETAIRWRWLQKQTKNQQSGESRPWKSNKVGRDQGSSTLLMLCYSLPSPAQPWAGYIHPLTALNPWHFLQFIVWGFTPVLGSVRSQCQGGGSPHTTPGTTKSWLHLCPFFRLLYNKKHWRGPCIFLNFLKMRGYGDKG